jgi:hypothetical protein
VLAKGNNVNPVSDVLATLVVASTSMSELSPAAQAVLDAANGAQCYGPDDCLNESRWVTAAALRAAANQVVPEMRTPWNSTLTPLVSAENVRAQLLAIAAELEAQ